MNSVIIVFHMRSQQSHKDDKVITKLEGL